MSEALPNPASNPAFPQSGAADFVPERAGILIKDRHGCHIPSFYQPHRNPETTVVTEGGVAYLPSFTVAQVAPERRWAITESGEVLSAMEFSDTLDRVRMDWFTVSQPGSAPPPDFNPKREPVPRVKKYVSVEVDPTDPTRLRVIGFDPSRTKGALPDVLVDADGGHGEARLPKLVEAYNDPKLRGRLQPKEVAEVQSHLAKSDSAAHPQDKISVLTELHDTGVLTDEQYADSLAKFGGLSLIEKSPAEQEEAKSKGPPKYTGAPLEAACGKSFEKGPLAIKMHERTCTACEAVKAKEADPFG